MSLSKQKMIRNPYLGRYLAELAVFFFPHRPVTKEQFQTLVTTLGFPSIQPQDEIDYVATLNAAVADLEAVAAMPAYTHPVFQKTKTATATTEETRTYTEPSPEENPLNAWRFRVCLFFPSLFFGQLISFMTRSR